MKKNFFTLTSVLLVISLLFGIPALADEVVDDECRNFDVQWQIVAPEIEDEEYAAPDGWYYLHFDLYITSESPEVLENVTPVVTFSEELRLNMTAKNWVNQPVTLYPLGSSDIPHGCEFGWAALISKDCPGLPADLNMDEIFDCTLQITWGSDVQLDNESEFVPTEEGADVHTVTIPLRFDEMTLFNDKNGPLLTAEQLQEII